MPRHEYVVISFIITCVSLSPSSFPTVTEKRRVIVVEVLNPCWFNTAKKEGFFPLLEDCIVGTDDNSWEISFRSFYGSFVVATEIFFLVLYAVIVIST